MEHALANPNLRWNRVWGEGATFEHIAAERARKLAKLERDRLGLTAPPPERPVRPQSAPARPQIDPTPQLRRRKQCPPAQRVRYNPRLGDPRTCSRE